MTIPSAAEGTGPNEPDTDYCFSYHVPRWTKTISERIYPTTLRGMILMEKPAFTTSVQGITTTYPIDQKMQTRLTNTFIYHAPKDDQPQRYEAIRAKAMELAMMIVTLTPPSREQSVSLTDLESTIFNANAAIARNE